MSEAETFYQAALAENARSAAFTAAATAPGAAGEATSDTAAEGGVRYYEDWDFERVYACVGDMGYGGLFRLQTHPMEWEFVKPDSPAWYGVTERIFNGHRADRVKEERVATFPPLPPVPPGPYPSAESYRLPKDPPKAEEFSRTAEWVREHGSGGDSADGGGHEATLWVVLNEDLWETRHGDGKFRYLEDVFATREEADVLESGGYTEYTPVPLVVTLSPVDEFAFPGFRLRSCDSYEPENAIKKFEGKLAVAAASDGNERKI